MKNIKPPTGILALERKLNKELIEVCTEAQQVLESLMSSTPTMPTEALWEFRRKLLITTTKAKLFSAALKYNNL